MNSDLQFAHFAITDLESALEILENELDLTECQVVRHICKKTSEAIRKNIRDRRRRIDDIIDNAIKQNIQRFQSQQGA